MAYVIACIAALAGLLNGYDESVITATLAPLGKTLLAEPMEAGLMTVTLPVGAFVGAVTGALLSAAWGRRSLLMGAAVLYVLGALFCAAAPGVVLFAVGRFLLGVAIAIGALAAPAYIAETAPAARRGLLLCAYPMAFTIGILAAYLVGIQVLEGWRLLFASAAVPGLILLVGLWRSPDTPAALVHAGREGDAGTLLARLNRWKSRDPRVAAGVAALREAARADMRTGNWRELLAPDLRPALVVGAGMFFFQQMTGISAALHYAPTVFALGGFDEGSAKIATTLGFGALNLVVMGAAMVLIDRVGRRPLLFAGFGGAAFSLCVLAAVAAVGTAEVQVFAFMGLALFAASFSLAIGPLPWVLAAEVFPFSVRGVGLALATLSNWVFGLLALVALPVLEAQIGFAGVYALAALMAGLALVFGARCVPETKGLTLEQIEAHLRAGQPLRMLGAPARR